MLIISGTALVGCAPDGGALDDDLTWQDAKSEAQQTQREIADLIDADQVIARDEPADGILLSCDATRHQWSGRIVLTLSESADADALARSVADRFRESDRFVVREQEDAPEGSPIIIQLIAPDNEENYIVAPYPASDELHITSASECFVLPEGVYPGGTF
ncbi:hypothetical protein [Agromyces aureus]|nr:hypothetical protein [Agromyces aureus]